MGKCSGRRKQNYIDCPRDQSKLTCLIHGPGNLSDEWKLLNDFGTEYSKVRTFKDHSQEPTTNKFYG